MIANEEPEYSNMSVKCSFIFRSQIIYTVIARKIQNKLTVNQIMTVCTYK